MSAGADLLSIENDEITGELALDIRPGTVADQQNRAVDAALTDALFEAANQLGAVVAAPAHRFAHPLPGKDEAGRVRFAIHGRVEGGRLIPDRSVNKKKKRR